MSLLSDLKHLLVGKTLDPFQPDVQRHIALIAFLAWIGLGADGLSSSCYGPEEAFVALGEHKQLSLYLAMATALTVFIIALAYNQVIELFPSGGGGYKVASTLLGPYAGMVSGAALLVDYVLTITISIASGADALFSLLPLPAQVYKLTAEIGLIGLLILLNLRGMKESIKVMLPIFMGFFLSHAYLIIDGIWEHAERLPELIPATLGETRQLSMELGWVAVAGLLLRAYSLGGGTYTGLEAVSNNVNTLVEPRVRTGKYTMLYMAVSLSFTAAGIILLYLLWDAARVPGQTLNATVFQTLIDSWNEDDPPLEQYTLWAVLALEAGLLLIAANTGFLGGPAVLANMAADSWMPHHFRNLSTRLVTQNGILLMGLGALLILLWTNGQVGLLVVLYSINVFLTFTLSLLGLVRYWWRGRLTNKRWRRRMVLPLIGSFITSAILVITLFEKFLEGGWLTVLITSMVIVVCLYIHHHYQMVQEKLAEVDRLLAPNKILHIESDFAPPKLDSSLPTAIFLVGGHRGVGMHTLLWVQRAFPEHFKNFLFVSVGEVDSQSFYGQGALRSLQYQIENTLHYFTQFCWEQGLAAKSYAAHGTDVEATLEELALKVLQEFPNSICFASKLIFEDSNWFTNILHNQTAIVMQERLHWQNQQMVVIPYRV